MDTQNRICELLIYVVNGYKLIVFYHSFTCSIRLSMCCEHTEEELTHAASVIKDVVSRNITKWNIEIINY